MKLLFDENLSHKLMLALADLYPGSLSMRSLGMMSAADDVIWRYARHHGMVIVTKDRDFSRRSLLLGHPPKVILIRLGNCSAEAVEALLRVSYPALLAFEQDAGAALLALA